MTTLAAIALLATLGATQDIKIQAPARAFKTLNRKKAAQKRQRKARRKSR